MLYVTSYYEYILRFFTLANSGIFFLLGIIFYFYSKIHDKTKNKNTRHDSIPLLLCITFIYLLFHAIFFNSVIRYVLFLYPLFIILLCNSINKFFSKTICVSIVIIICFNYCYYQWKQIQYSQHIVYDTEDILFLPHQQFNIKAIKQIEMMIQDNPVAVGWPILHYLNNPLFGYIVNPFPSTIDIDLFSEIHDDELISKLPHQQKTLLILLYPCSYPYTKLITIITPDWPHTALDKFYIYEYYNPNPKLDLKKN